MTLIVSWIGADCKQGGSEVASLYIASDSRYTWGTSGQFDYGIKVFGAISSPEIFGFSGDVSFPSTAITQIVNQIDNGILLNALDDGYEKNRKIFDFIRTSLDVYPKIHLAGDFTILHGTRFEKTFRLFQMSYGHKKGLEVREIPLGNVSTKVYSGGSGRVEFDRNWQVWEDKRHNNYRTSRAVYHCLYKTLDEIRDPSTGGRPQIVGLYRVKNARLFGIVEDGKRYIYGKASSTDLNFVNIEWRNKNFERVSPESLSIIEGAQRQPS